MSLANAHKLLFDLPAMARLGAIRLTDSASDGVIPAKLFGRKLADDPWTFLSATTLRPGGGATFQDLSGPPMTSYQIVADSRTVGFSAPPTLELLFNPIDLLVALSGTPPYRLAVGQRDAPATYLTLAEIASHGVPLKLADLPSVNFAPPSKPPLIVAVQATAPEKLLEPRKLMLWAALLIGTMVLAFAAVRLMRTMPSDPAVENDEIARPR